MSTTETTNAGTSDTVAKRKLTAAIKPVLALLGTVSTALAQAETDAERASDALGHARVAVGRVLGQISAKALADGVPAEMIQTRLIDLVRAGTDGRVYEWDTLNQWIGAAATEASLPDSLHDVFTVDSLRVIGRVPAKATADGASDERIDFARQLQSDGATSNRAVRAAYKARTEANGSGKGTTERNALSVANKLQPDFQSGAKTLRKLIAKHNVPANVAQSIALFGSAVGGAAKGDAEVASLMLQALLDAKQDTPKPGTRRRRPATA